MRRALKGRQIGRPNKAEAGVATVCGQSFWQPHLLPFRRAIPIVVRFPRVENPGLSSVVPAGLPFGAEYRANPGWKL